jgi:cytochrome c-type biogenesis protein CcmH
MIWFIVIAVVLVAVALLWIMPVLLRHNRSGGLAAEATNLAVLRDQLGEIDRDVANGTLSQQQFEQARADLDRRVLEDTRATSGQAVAQTGDSRRTAFVLALGIPVCAALLYVQIGNPGAISSKAVVDAGPHKVTAEQVAEMTARLAAKLNENPGDGNGWALLGRSYMVMQRYDDASAAYAHATALIKDDAGLLADYADALGMQQGRRIDGKPLQMIELALKIDPGHWKALAMAGSAAFERKDYRKAVGYWEKLQSVVPPDSEFARSVASNLQEARELGGIKPGAPQTAAIASKPAIESKPAIASKPAPGPAPAAAVASGASVRGSVSLAGALAGKAAPADTVFIFARAAEGPRMPLAIMRLQVKDLPATFTLDDSQAMSPAMKLSNFAEVVIGARVSKSANAMPQSGDLQGFSQKIKSTASAVKIVIDQVVP